MGPHRAGHLIGQPRGTPARGQADDTFGTSFWKPLLGCGFVHAAWAADTGHGQGADRPTFSRRETVGGVTPARWNSDSRVSRLGAGRASCLIELPIWRWSDH